MQIDDVYREKVGKRIALLTADALDAKKLTIDEYNAVADAMLHEFPSLQTHDALLEFLDHLAQVWPVFSPIHDDEKNVRLHEVESEKAKEIETLMKSQQVDKAIEVMDTQSQTDHSHA